jgi:hypothetical protein
LGNAAVACPTNFYLSLWDLGEAIFSVRIEGILHSVCGEPIERCLCAHVLLKVLGDCPIDPGINNLPSV